MIMAINNSYNKRVVGLVSWCYLSEPFGSGFGLFVLRRDRSDSAVHGNH